mmetsp:Transcript_9549/g.31183  ORF Transcript_9549/g.31183 Transcript_9549/m.31183 type:complete len:227 (+) Transcript_9549:2029-2709(+)
MRSGGVEVEGVLFASQQGREVVDDRRLLRGRRRVRRDGPVPFAAFGLLPAQGRRRPNEQLVRGPSQFRPDLCGRRRIAGDDDLKVGVVVFLPGPFLQKSGRHTTAACGGREASDRLERLRREQTGRRAAAAQRTTTTAHRGRRHVPMIVVVVVVVGGVLWVIFVVFVLVFVVVGVDEDVEGRAPLGFVGGAVGELEGPELEGLEPGFEGQGGAGRGREAPRLGSGE